MQRKMYCWVFEMEVVFSIRCFGLSQSFRARHDNVVVLLVMVRLSVIMVNPCCSCIFLNFCDKLEFCFYPFELCEISLSRLWSEFHS
jgi:hypothetical protein